MQQQITSPWARLAFVLLSLMWLGAGWFILLQGGFHKTVKYSRETTFVDGGSAIAMAWIFLALAAISAAVVLQSGKASRVAYGIVLGCILGTPAIMLFLKGFPIPL